MADEREQQLPRQRLLLGEWAVDVRGAGPRGGPNAGRPLVLVHGIGMSGDYFLPFARVMARQRRVYLLDLPGYGSTPKPPEPLSVPQLADAARTAVARLALRNPVLVGQSMGCQVVADAVAADPTSCAGYILIGPTVDPAAHGTVRMASRLGRDILRESAGNNAVVLRDYLRMGPLRYLRTSRFMLADRIEETIGGCAAPGLVVRGGRDPIAPRAWVDQLARLAPDAVTAEVPGAAHNVQHTHPDQLARACAAFLSRVAPI
ncbi:MAG: alpha/beta fold hydrolase [Actinomycetes bacterium]